MRVILQLDARRPAPGLLDLARGAAHAGWDGVRVCDAAADPARPGGHIQGEVDGRECWAVVAALSEAVPRVRLDAVVRDDLGRHPAVVAKMAATVDQLSGGRLLLGLVPGGGPDGEARLAEGIQVVKGLASGERFSFPGRFYQLHDAPLDPGPVQRPFPVMVVEGSAEFAATYADHWSISGTPAQVDERLATLRAACQRLGRDPATITVSALAPLTSAVGAGARSTTPVAGAEQAAWRPDAAGRAALAAYRAAGVDEWVVPDRARGPERAGWAEVLAQIAGAVHTIPQT